MAGPTEDANLLTLFKTLGHEKVLKVFVEAFFPTLSLVQLFKSVGVEKVLGAVEEAFPDLKLTVE